MSSEQLVAVVTAVTALLVAMLAVLRQLHDMRQDLDGRLSQLVDQTAEHNRKLGELEGRDFMRRLQNPPPDAPA